MAKLQHTILFLPVILGDEIVGIFDRNYHDVTKATGLELGVSLFSHTCTKKPPLNIGTGTAGANIDCNVDNDYISFEMCQRPSHILEAVPISETPFRNTC